MNIKNHRCRNPANNNNNGSSSSGSNRGSIPRIKDSRTEALSSQEGNGTFLHPPPLLVRTGLGGRLPVSAALESAQAVSAVGNWAGQVVLEAGVGEELGGAGEPFRGTTITAL